MIIKRTHKGLEKRCIFTGLLRIWNGMELKAISRSDAEENLFPHA